MYSQSILPERLSTFEYYENKLPMWLRSSTTFKEHFRIWYDLMIQDISYEGVINTLDWMLYLVNIFDNTPEYLASGKNLYLENLLNLPGTKENVTKLDTTDSVEIVNKKYLTFNEVYKATRYDVLLDGKSIGKIRTQNEASDPDRYGDKSDWLDKIGELFGVKRALSVQYTENNIVKTEQLNLNNEDFLKLIQCQIIKNYFNGSYEQIKQYYEKVGLRVLYINAEEEATCNVYLLKTEDSAFDYSDNIKKLFLSGLMLIESAGIKYTTGVIDLGALLIWDKPVTGNYTGWDYGEWVA